MTHGRFLTHHITLICRQLWPASAPPTHTLKVHVVYVHDIPRGRGWEETGNLHKLVLIKGRKENVSFAVAFYKTNGVWSRLSGNFTHVVPTALVHRYYEDLRLVTSSGPRRSDLNTCWSHLMNAMLKIPWKMKLRPVALTFLFLTSVHA